MSWALANLCQLILLAAEIKLFLPEPHLTTIKHCSIPKVDEELQAKTIFEPVAVETRPAKAKSKVRNKLKWKEGYQKSEESTSPSKGSGAEPPIFLNMMIGTDSSREARTAEEKPSSSSEKLSAKSSENKATKSSEKAMPHQMEAIKSRKKAHLQQQSLLWTISRKVLEEVLIWMIILIILITARLRQ